MKISLIEPIGVPKELIDELSEKFVTNGNEFVYFDNKTSNTQELVKRGKDSDIIITANNPINSEVISGWENLKVLDVAFTGLDHISIKSCQDKGIKVLNATNYSDQSVAELCIGLSLDLLRKITQGDFATRAGSDAMSSSLMGMELCSKTVGIVGLGNIGMKTAKLFKAFGCRVVGYSRSKKAEAEKFGIEQLELEEVLKISDIVSLHIPSNDETKHFMDKNKINMMKKTSLLINCSRGAVVDNEFLAKALNEGVIAGAGIDVFDLEPPLSKDYSLLNCKNIVLTPHVAYLTREAMIKRAYIVFENIEDYVLNNGALKNIKA